MSAPRAMEQAVQQIDFVDIAVRSGSVSCGRWMVRKWPLRLPDNTICDDLCDILKRPSFFHAWLFLVSINWV